MFGNVSTQIKQLCIIDTEANHLHMCPHTQAKMSHLTLTARKLNEND